MIDLKLISTGGDMHTGGLSDKPTEIKIDYKHKRSVDAFLKHQNAFNNIAFDKSFPNKSSKKAYKKYLNSFLKLMNIGIFDCKWDFRTSWEYKDE
jgi:hypothetical protein|tara:strand:- start:436 stop:720 length:285 start_codon:yes stop_codon:yes gene_type:complete